MIAETTTNVVFNSEIARLVIFSPIKYPGTGAHRIGLPQFH